MKKSHLKKLALMGITGGVILAQTPVNAEIDLNSSSAYMLAAHDCSSSNGCSSSNPNGNSGSYNQGNSGYTNDTNAYIPPSTRPYNQENQNYNNPNPNPNLNPSSNMPRNSGYSSMNEGTTQGCASKSYTSMNQGTTQGCASKSYTSMNQGTTQGCASKSNVSMNQGMTHGCASAQGYKNDMTIGDADEPQTRGEQRRSQRWGNDAQDDQSNQGYQGQQQRRNRYNQPQDQMDQQQDQMKNQSPTQMPSQMNPNSYQSVRMNPTRHFLADSSTDTTTKAGTMSEADLMKQLNDQTKSIYLSLSPEGKALALQMANQSCKGQNTCKGLNSCKSDKNDCAGKGSCKGTTVGPFQDKNEAVKIAAKKMAEKRASMAR